MSETKLNYIAGDWLDGPSTIENINPSDLADVIGHFAQADASQLDKALDAARQAQKEWAATGLEARQTILMNIG
ncbi:MAG: aldehyde dehydrogenase family protein, partial [Alphaproteobacteria bacterium]